MSLSWNVDGSRVESRMLKYWHDADYQISERLYPVNLCYARLSILSG